MPLPEDIPSAEQVTPKKEPFFYGGQAVIEGVMMRGKRHYAVAVRVPTTKEIVIDRGELKASIYTSRFWKLPFVRGIALIGEQMHLMPTRGRLANDRLEVAVVREMQRGKQNLHFRAITRRFFP